MKRFIGLFLIGLILSSCSRGPDAGALKQEIQTSLDANFRQGLFTVESLRRTGSAPTGIGGETGLLVYFNAEIVFLEDYDLTSWEELNVGVLANVLGATEAGISGVTANGNKKGDVLKVYGRTTYRADGDSWKPVAGVAGGQIAAVPDLDNTAPQSKAELLLAEIGTIANTTGTNVRGTETEIVEKELTSALKNINLKLDALQGTASLTSGETMGEYYRVGQAIAEQLSGADAKIHNYPSAGSVENCKLLQDGAVDLALVQNDIAAMAYLGEGVFSERKPMENLRALASLFPEPIQIVVPAASDIKTVADLKGKKVDLGLPGSGSRVNAELVIKSHGLSLEDLGGVGEKGIDASVEMIQSGAIDAFVVTVAAPAKLLQTLAAHLPIRLLSLDQQALQMLAENNPYYVPVTLPAKIYSGQEEPVHTLSVTAMLVANKDLPDDKVTRLLEGLFSNVAAIAKAGFQASFIDRAKARQGVTIPLHPGAEQYYSKS